MFKTKLTLKQYLFIKAYLGTGNATEAAMEIYSCKNRNTAGVIGWENLRKPKIKKEIQEILLRNDLTIDLCITSLKNILKQKPAKVTGEVYLEANIMLAKLHGMYPD